MKIKRLFCLLLAGILVFSLCACSGGNMKANDTKKAKVNSANSNSLVQSGNTPIEEGLDFGGKTVTYAIGLPLSDTMKRQLLAFEKKYNCKVETDLLGFQDFVQILASRMAGGKVYDIIQLEGLRFPAIAIAQFVEPLENVISTADWAGADYTKGGFVEEETMQFVWDGHLYAVVCSQGEFSSKVAWIAYNKKLIAQAGAEDPRELYEKGEWDWDAVRRVGEKVAKNTDACLFNYYDVGSIVSTNGAYRIDFSDKNNPKANLTSPAYINALNFVQELMKGTKPILNPIVGDYQPNAFFEGKMAFSPCAPYDLYDNKKLAAGVLNSNAFDKNIDNLGFVPYFIGPDNKNKTCEVSSWVYGIGVGKGTQDPKIAMAFAKHASTYSTVSTTGEYKYSEADRKLLLEIQKSKKIGNFARFADGSNGDGDLINKMNWEVIEGGDVSQIVSSYNAQIQNCIDVTMAQQ